MANILLALCLVHLSVLMSVAGLSKSLAPSAFSDLLNDHGLIPRHRTLLVARGVIASEFVLGLWLISGIQYRIAAAATAGLLALFLLYRVALRVLGPKEASCGCLGNSSTADAVGVVLNLGIALTVFALGVGPNLYETTPSILLAIVWIVGILSLIARHRRVNPVASWRMGES